MICQNCHQPVEQGAAFCGNCGQALYIPQVQSVAAPATANSVPGQFTPPIAPTPPPSSQQKVPAMPMQPTTVPQPPAPAGTGVPAYAMTPVAAHPHDAKALYSLLAGIFGTLSALFVPVLAVVLGILGIVFGTMSRQSNKRMLSTVGIVFSVIAILAGLASWAYAIDHQKDKQKTSKALNEGPVNTVADLSTPCYTVNFVDRLNTTGGGDICDIKAYNADTFEESTTVYKVLAVKSQNVTASNFTQIAKQALEKDIKTNLPDFTIDSQRVAAFAGSPAYTITATDKDSGIAFIETAVYKPVKNGENIFIIVHGINGDKADLSLIEAKWRWK
jgi:fumarate reductase subunit D